MTGIGLELTLAVGFLTRLRLPPVDYSDAAMARAIRWYPAIGLAIGTILALLFWGLSMLFPQPVAALLAIAAGMLLTGALHEDGLADLADGLGGQADKSRALEIMRDSRIGTYGMLTLGLTLALKIAALATLPTFAAAVAIIAGHGLGRFTMTWLMDRLPYARVNGAAGFMAEDQNSDMRPVWAAFLCVFILVGVSIGIIAAIATTIALFALASFMAMQLKRRLEGYTGDALGACEQLTEALVPIVFLACL